MAFECGARFATGGFDDSASGYAAFLIGGRPLWGMLRPFIFAEPKPIGHRRDSARARRTVRSERGASGAYRANGACGINSVYDTSGACGTNNVYDANGAYDANSAAEWAARTICANGAWARKARK